MTSAQTLPRPRPFRNDVGYDDRDDAHDGRYRGDRFHDLGHNQRDEHGQRHHVRRDDSIVDDRHDRNDLDCGNGRHHEHQWYDHGHDIRDYGRHDHDWHGRCGSGYDAHLIDVDHV